MLHSQLSTSFSQKCFYIFNLVNQNQQHLLNVIFAIGFQKITWVAFFFICLMRLNILNVPCLYFQGVLFFYNCAFKALFIIHAFKIVCVYCICVYINNPFLNPKLILIAAPQEKDEVTSHHFYTGALPRPPQEAHLRRMTRPMRFPLHRHLHAEEQKQSWEKHKQSALTFFTPVVSSLAMITTCSSHLSPLPTLPPLCNFLLN